MSEPRFRRTGYPLNPSKTYEGSDPKLQALWDISLRTLENCMMETYMDCPYYEQLQFAMDTRLEAIYTYAVGGDTRLVKKALTDFHYGMQPEGLTTGKYPSAYLQILSTFSLHYIYMMQEYLEETGDLDFVREIACDADRILDYYDRHMGPDGLLRRLQFWNFVDWQDQWQKSAGAPEWSRKSGMNSARGQNFWTFTAPAVRKPRKARAPTVMPGRRSRCTCSAHNRAGAPPDEGIQSKTASQTPFR